MTTGTAGHHPDRSRVRNHDSAEFRLLVAATYPIFLAAAVASALVPKRGFVAGSGQKRSIFEVAKANANKTIPFVFMG